MRQLSKKQKKSSKKTGGDTGDSTKRQETNDLPPGAANKQELDRLTEWIHENIDRLPNDFHAMPLNHELITGVLTKEGIRIVNHLREHGPVDSLQDLADALGRDRAAVSRDLVLLQHRLVEVEKKGRQKTIRALDRPIIIY